MATTLSMQVLNVLSTRLGYSQIGLYYCTTRFTTFLNFTETHRCHEGLCKQLFTSVIEFANKFHLDY